MARVIKPGSVFQTAYEPLDTGGWKTRVLDANRALSQQWRDPKVVMKAGNVIGGLVANQHLKSRDRKAAAERVRQSSEGQKQLGAASDWEQKRMDRDKINREALFKARKIIKRRKLETPEDVKWAENIIGRAGRHDWEGKAAQTRYLGKARLNKYVTGQMEGGAGSLAEARSLAAAASHAEDPAEALKLREAAALARSRAYDKARGATLTDVISGKIEGEETRKDLKELFPPIMRKPEERKGRGGPGPTGAHSQEPVKALRDQFKASPKIRASRLAVDIRNAGFIDPNKQFTNTPAGMSQVPVGSGNLGTQLKSMFVEVPAMRVGGTGAGTEMAWIRSPTKYELGLIDKPGGYTREQLYTILAREARAAFLAAADIDQLRIDIGEISELDKSIDNLGMTLGAAHRGTTISTGVDAGLKQKYFGTGALMPPTLATPSDPKPDPPPDDVDKPDGDPSQNQQAREDVLKSMRMKMRQVRSAYRRDTDDGISPERLQRAKDILGAKGNEDIEAIRVIEMIR